MQSRTIINDKQTNNMSQSRFMSLPAEIRNMIYEFALSAGKPVHRIRASADFKAKDSTIPDEKNVTALFRVSKTIFCETERMFYDINTISVSRQELTRAFRIRPLQGIRADYIRDLRVPCSSQGMFLGLSQALDMCTRLRTVQIEYDLADVDVGLLFHPLKPVCVDVGHFQLVHGGLIIDIKWPELIDAWEALVCPRPLIRGAETGSEWVRSEVYRNVGMLAQAHGPSDGDGMVPEEIWVLRDLDPPIDIRRIRVLDAEKPGAELLARFNERLSAWLRWGVEDLTWHERG